MDALLKNLHHENSTAALRALDERTFMTPGALELRERIETLRRHYALGDALGFAKFRYSRYAALHERAALGRLWVDAVFPAVV